MQHPAHRHGTLGGKEPLGHLIENPRGHPHQELPSPSQAQGQTARPPNKILRCPSHYALHLNGARLPRLPCPWPEGGWLDSEWGSWLSHPSNLRHGCGSNGTGLSPQGQRSSDCHDVTTGKVGVATLGEHEHSDASRCIFDAIESLLGEFAWSCRNDAAQCDEAVQWHGVNLRRRERLQLFVR